jgi:hypothetical protein
MGFDAVEDPPIKKKAGPLCGANLSSFEPPTRTKIEFPAYNSSRLFPPAHLQNSALKFSQKLSEIG